MRVLILTCNLGGGHNTAARALAEYFTDNGIFCEIRDALAFTSNLPSTLTEKAYITSTKGNAWAFGTVYNVGIKLSSLRQAVKKPVKSPVYYANSLFGRTLHKYIKFKEFDVVVCTHFFPAETLTYLKKYKKLKTKNFLIATDYTIHPFMNETTMDGYFVPHELVVEEFVSFGLPREKIFQTGIPVGKKYTQKKDKAEVRNELGLDVDAKVVLMMSGSMGFGDNTELIKNILSVCSKNVKIIVVCGNNKKAFDELDGIFSDDKRVDVVGFTDKIPEYMDACDVVITKPGGLSTTEAAAKNIPIIHSKAIPGCETRNVEIFDRFGMSIHEDDPFKIACLTDFILNNKDYQDKMIKNQNKHINKFGARDTCEKIKEIYRR